MKTKWNTDYLNAKYKAPERIREFTRNKQNELKELTGVRWSPDWNVNFVIFRPIPEYATDLEVDAVIVDRVIGCCKKDTRLVVTADYVAGALGITCYDACKAFVYMVRNRLANAHPDRRGAPV